MNENPFILPPLRRNFDGTPAIIRVGFVQIRILIRFLNKRIITKTEFTEKIVTQINLQIKHVEQ